MSFYTFWFSSRSWKSLWIALRRSHRDSHARANALRLLFYLVFVVAYVGFYVYQFRGMKIGDGLALLIGIGAFVLLKGGNDVYLRWEQHKQERENPSVAPKLKLDLYRETCLLATLLERLGSEMGMEKELPPGFVVITRRVLLDRLNAFNLRDDLEPWLLDILLAPDGHWLSELKSNALQAWECLSALMWVLGMGELRGLTLDPKYSLTEARSLFVVKQPAKLNVLPAWDIRPARNEADHFFTRCWSELAARQELDGISDQDVADALEARAKIQAEGYTSDYLIGPRTVPELPSPALWFAAIRAYNRWQTLSLLVEVTSCEKPVSDLRSLFAQFFLAKAAGE